MEGYIVGEDGAWEDVAGCQGGSRRAAMAMVKGGTPDRENGVCIFVAQKQLLRTRAGITGRMYKHVVECAGIQNGLRQ